MAIRRYWRSDRTRLVLILPVLFFLFIMTFILSWVNSDETLSDVPDAVHSQVLMKGVGHLDAARLNNKLAQEQTDFFESLLNLTSITPHGAEIIQTSTDIKPNSSEMNEKKNEKDGTISWDNGEVVVVTPEPDKLESSDRLRFSSKHTGITGHELLYAFFEQVVPDNLSGKLNVHIWHGICGPYVEQLRYSPLFPRFPFIRKFSEALQSKYEASDFGQRMFGFIHPESSGDYQFAITSDDTSELWLSTDSNPKRSRLIAAVYSATGVAWTTPHNYKKYPIQISRNIPLKGSRRYYVEVLHKQGKGQSHVQVLWKRPKSQIFEIIGKNVVSLFVDDREMHGEDSMVQDIDFNSYAPSGIPSHMKRKLDSNVKNYLYHC